MSCIAPFIFLSDAQPTLRVECIPPRETLIRKEPPRRRSSDGFIRFRFRRLTVGASRVIILVPRSEVLTAACVSIATSRHR